MKINEIEIKPGMVFSVKYDEDIMPTVFVVFPLKTKGLAVIQYGVSNKYPYGCWEHITRFYENNKDYIVEIRDLTDQGFLHGGKLLWKKGTVIVTIEDIAKKFNCKPEQIKIV